MYSGDGTTAADFFEAIVDINHSDDVVAGYTDGTDLYIFSEGVDDNANDDVFLKIVGVGDTVTSIKDTQTNSWLRGGSDRGFLTLIQK